MKNLIFVLEDSLVVSNLIKYSIETSLNCEVITFETENEMMLNMLRKPSLVILDYYLNHNSTSETTFKKIKKLTDDIPVIFFSGQNNTDIKNNLIHSGAEAYIDKNETKFLDNLIFTSTNILAKKDLKLKLDQEIKLKNRTKKNLFTLLFILSFLSISLMF